MTNGQRKLRRKYDKRQAECSSSLAADIGCHIQCPCPCREASPGKLGAFEDELFRNADMADVPVVAAIALAYVEGARTVRTARPRRKENLLASCHMLLKNQA